MRKPLFAITATSMSLALTVMPETGFGAPICGTRDDVTSGLKKNHEESPIARGLANAGQMIEVFASPEGTFTIVATRPDGTSCLLAAGEAWHKLVTVGVPSGSS